MLLKDSPRPQLAHAYVDSWSSKRLRNGSRTITATGMEPASQACVERPPEPLQLTNPRAVTEPNAHLDRDIPRRAVTRRPGKR